MSLIQSILIPRDNFTLKEAYHFINKYGLKNHFGNKIVDITDKYYRFRQLKPSKNVMYRTIDLNKHGIKAIVQIKK